METTERVVLRAQHRRAKHLGEWTAAPLGRRISLHGELRSSEVRVHRGGVALLSLLPSHFSDVRRAHRDGRLAPLVGGSRGGASR
jgi:hypothetical protein